MSKQKQTMFLIGLFVALLAAGYSVVVSMNTRGEVETIRKEIKGSSEDDGGTEDGSTSSSS